MGDNFDTVRGIIVGVVSVLALIMFGLIVWMLVEADIMHQCEKMGRMLIDDTAYSCTRIEP